MRPAARGKRGSCNVSKSVAWILDGENGAIELSSKVGSETAKHSLAPHVSLPSHRPGRVPCPQVGPHAKVPASEISDERERWRKEWNLVPDITLSRFLIVLGSPYTFFAASWTAADEITRPAM